MLDLLRKWQLGGGEGEKGMPDFIRDPEDDEDDDHDFSASSSRSNSPIDANRLPDSDEALLAMLSDEQRNIFLEAVGRSENGLTPQATRNSDRAKMLWDKIVADEHRRNRQAAAAQQQEGAGEGQGAAPPAPAPEETANLWWLASSQTIFQPHSDDFAAKLAALQAAQSNGSSPHPAGVGLAWNVVCLLLAYTYTLLHLDVPSFSSIIGSDNANLLSHSLRLMQRLVPFVLPTSTTSEETRLLLDSPSAATAYILARLGDADRSQRPSALMLELWTRSASLWARDKAVVVNDQAAASRSASRTTAALCDIWQLCEWGMENKGCLPPGIAKKTLQLAAHKVIFFAAQMARLRTTLARGAQSVSVEEQHVLGLDLESILPSRDGPSNLEDMSRANGEHQREGASVAAMMARRREPKTMGDEIVALRREVEALEDEERQRAAWTLMGGGEQAIDPVVAAPDVKQQTKVVRGPVIEVMEAAPSEGVPAVDGEGGEPHEMLRPSIAEVSDEKAGESAQPSPPVAAKKSFAAMRKSRQERSAPSRLVPSRPQTESEGEEDQ